MLLDLLNDASYVGHGYCLLWNPWLVGLHAGSDLLIFASYSAIPVAIWLFIRKRPNLEMRNLARLFAAFILWCGLTHIINLVTLWYPIYEIQGLVKGITAVISVYTATAIFPLIPVALAIPSPAELKIANQALAREIEAHNRTLAELEQRVKDRTRELDDLSRRYQVLFERAPVSILVLDEDGIIQQANTSAGLLFGRKPAELVGSSVEHLVPESVRARHQTLRKGFMSSPETRPMGLGRELNARRSDGREVPVEIGLNPVKVDGSTCVIATIIDITDRRNREQQINLLMREVNHRSKNMLSVVQSIARHTATTDPAEFVERFSARVRALAANQDLLISSDWRGAEVHDLVEAQLAHLGDLVGARIRLDGPDLRLSAAAAQTIGMALHELATNAVKHGALSNPAGTVTIGWHLTDAPEGARFAIEWKEEGGPAMSAPQRKGFGTTVLKSMAELGLGAAVDLAFEAAGLCWRLECPALGALEAGDWSVPALASEAGS